MIPIFTLSSSLRACPAGRLSGVASRPQATGDCSTRPAAQCCYHRAAHAFRLRRPALAAAPDGGGRVRPGPRPAPARPGPRRPVLLLLRLAARPLSVPPLASQRDDGGPAPAAAGPQPLVEPAAVAGPGPAGARAPGPGPLAPSADRPREEGQACGDHPRPVLPQAPGHDGGRDPAGLRAPG